MDNFQRVKIKDALPGQLRDFANNFLGMSVPGNAKTETIIAKIQTAWPGDSIMIPAEPAVLQDQVTEKPNEEAAQQATQPTPDATSADPEKPAAVAQPPAPPAPATAEQGAPKPGYVRVLIMASEEKGGNEPVELSVNGSAMLVPRGDPSDIPYHYFEVLKNADQYFYDPLPDGGINPKARVVKAYQYQVLAHTPARQAA